MKRLFTLTVAVAAAALAGCDTLTLTKPRYDPALVSAIQSRIKGRTFVALVYEGVPIANTDDRKSVFQFSHSALLDRALVDQKYRVVDRALIQKIIEAQPLPSTGSFPEEDLRKIAAQAHAEILVVGYYYGEPKHNLVMPEGRTVHVILRALDLRTGEVINSVQTTMFNEGTWDRLTKQVFYIDD